MSQSTPLEKLDGPGANDASLVNKILSDMNEGSGQSMGNPKGAAFEQGPPRLVLQEPPIQSTQEYTMDPAPATAHLIGNSTPSAQDFSSMMASFGQVQQENPVAFAHRGKTVGNKNDGHLMPQVMHRVHHRALRQVVQRVGGPVQH